MSASRGFPLAESHRIEFKESLSENVDIEKEVIAFLNNDGGTIYVGINDKGQAVDIHDIDGDILKIKDRIRNNIAPSPMGLFDIHSETMQTKKIIRIIVASGCEKPYYKMKYGMTSKGCFVRIGTASEPMPQNMIERLFAERTRDSIGKIKSYRQDLKFEQLKIYYQEKGLLLNDNFARTLELLTDDGHYNYAAYLLSDENNISIKVAKYSGVDRVDLIESKDFGHCSLIKAVKNVLSRVIEIENSVFTKITPFEREEARLWDEKALREAIINAFVHNNYSLEIFPKFEIFSDRIEITSAGRIPDTLTEKDFFGGVSVPRNKELMRIFGDLELVESLGSGVPRILKVYSQESFIFLDNFTRIVLPKKNEKVKSQDDFLENFLEKDKNFLENFLEKNKNFLEKTKYAKRIVEFIHENAKISSAELAFKIGVTDRTVRKELKALKEGRVIRRIGPDKGGRWELISEEGV